MNITDITFGVWLPFFMAAFLTPLHGIVFFERFMLFGTRLILPLIIMAGIANGFLFYCLGSFIKSKKKDSQTAS
jgi:hypothetical protein